MKKCDHKHGKILTTDCLHLDQFSQIVRVIIAKVNESKL